jgi:hypothetical protein
MLWIAAGPELSRLRITGGQQFAITQKALQLTRYCRTGIDQNDRRREHLGE